MAKVKLHYSISNNGDGSSSVHFWGTAADAEKADEDEIENGEGLSESTASYITLRVEDGKVFYDDYDYERVGKELVRVDKTVELTND